jgi:hypothetical protein
MMQRHPNIIGDSKCDLEDFGNGRVSEAFARKSAGYRKSRHQNQGRPYMHLTSSIVLVEDFRQILNHNPCKSGFGGEDD